MLRTLVLLLVIATPLLSQDLLVDAIDREFSGTLIEITDTDIIFQIQGETEPVQYPFWAVKRVTLADGSLAFEDGKTYVAKPTLPVKARPAEPMPEEPPPEEPRPEEITDDEKDKRPPLLSQDLLVDSEGYKYSGTLIEITDTHIHFQLPGRTRPIQIPLKSVKRVTLANGSIAYEYDKIYEVEPAEKAEIPPLRVGIPPLNGVRIAGEAAAGWVGGLALGLGGVYAGAWIGEMGGSSGYEALGTMVIGFLIGYPLGVASGVYLVGNIGDETGSFKATLGGSILGGIASIGILFIGEPALALAFPFLPTIGATIGFNMTRRYKTPAESETGLINFRDSRASLAVPAIYFRPNPFVRGDIAQTIDLVKVSF